MRRHVQSRGEYSVSFIRDPFFEEADAPDVPLVKAQRADLLQMTDLVVRHGGYLEGERGGG